MIYIHRDWSTVPDDVKTALKAAADALEKITDADKRKAYIRENGETWTAVRQYLSGMSAGKCWYSEAKEAVSRYQVDHFRPHGRSKQSAREYYPGYSWLAFDLDNFRLAGVLCNTANQEYSEETVGKSDWFPLVDPTKRATLDLRNTGRETPILLDPADPDDPAKLIFLDTGNVTPDPDLDDQTKQNVEIAITCLGLRQTMLNERRRSLWRRCSRAIGRYKDVERIPKGERTERDQKNINDAREELVNMAKASSEFAATARCCLIAHGLRRLIVADEFLPLAEAAGD
ncbi:hypothetical protein [Burkholderia vietnamiensis]|uniref:hypothetical protein n=1 Tax=Burkholderia vietnamiensis TaxID=60552 RepID=UPI0012DB1061|nr:hypothetical protein [Burkholderia vietnamiensis]